MPKYVFKDSILILKQTSLDHSMELKSIRIIKKGIWVYFLLLIFEGALRKWVLPGLATPLLLIRDPIAIWIIFKVWSQNLFPVNFYIISSVMIGFVGIITAVLFGHGNILVAFFGARILLIHFILIFAIGAIFTSEDVIKLGIVTLWITIPMTILIAFQFYSPQSALVNRGVGGDLAGGGFSGSMNFLRPPGTFSFTSGVTQFYSFAGCFILYFWFSTKRVNRLILTVATIGLIAAIPLSISRGLLFQICLSGAFMAIAILRKPTYLGRMVLITIGVIGILKILSQTYFFHTATEAFIDRFNLANENEGGVNGVFVDRFLGGMVSAISDSSALPFWGYGLGMGTNVGSQMLIGERIFLITEGEWGRIIGELGILLGISVIIIRISLTIEIALACYKRLKNKDILPWILLGLGGISLAQSGWAQPTSLGFCTLISGLMISSLRVKVLK